MTAQATVFAGIREARQLRDSRDRAGAQAILDELWRTVTADGEEGDEYLAIAVAHDYGHLETEPAEQLRWHLDALGRIERFEPQEEVRLFWASAYANVGQAYLRLGDVEQARRYLGLADAAAAVLDDDAYGRTVREGIASGLRALDDGWATTADS